jgi:hypothetical protein
MISIAIANDAPAANLIQAPELSRLTLLRAAAAERLTLGYTCVHSCHWGPMRHTAATEVFLCAARTE